MSSRSRRRPVPTWFLVALTLAWAGVCHVLGLHALEDAAPSSAFLGFLLLLGSLIWDGIQAAGHLTLLVVATSVQALWAFARGVWNAAKALGVLTQSGLKIVWRFSREVFDTVLKPAWEKFFALVDRVKGALTRVLKPVFAFLNKIRTELLQFYTKWIRPVLDTIDAVRKILKVLETLHVSFAAKLDAELGRIEALIDKPFRFVLGELNKIINFVNRIATADGLFQRLALIRSIERDIAYVHREFANALHREITPDERTDNDTATSAKSVDQVTRDLRDYLQTGSGDDGALIDEQVDQWRIYLRAS